MKRLSVILLFINLILVRPAFGAFGFDTEKQDAGQAGAFLDFAASARSLGMGRAFTAVADDAGATYWNPSGLAQLRQNNLVSLYSVLESDTNYGFFSYGHPTLNSGGFGMSLVSLTSGGFDKRSAQGVKMGEAKLSETAVLFSHGFSLKRVSLGSTVKLIRQNADIYSATGYGFDAGLMMPLGSKWQAGLNLRNLIAPKLQLKNASETYTRDLQMGLKFAPTKNLMLASDFTRSQNRSLKMAIGGEYNLTPLLALRAGLNESELAAGLGFRLGNWNLDYAFAQATELAGVERLGNSHRFGIDLRFGKSITDRREELVREQYQRQALSVLVGLRKKMNLAFIPEAASMEQILNEAKDTIKYRGFASPSDLYETQGYIYYFEKKFTQSVYYMGEALNLSTGADIDLKRNYEKALVQMNEEQKGLEADRLVTQAIDFFEKKNWSAAIRTFEKVLLIRPNDPEASLRIEYAKKFMREPYQEAMAQGTKAFNEKRYLDAVRYFSQAKALEPTSAEVAPWMTQAVKALEEESKDGVATIGGMRVEPAEQNVLVSREYYSKGLAFYSQGKLKEALSAWKDAVRYDVSNTSAQRAYERAQLELNQKP